MRADQLAKELGISRPWLFHIKRKFASAAPKNFEDVEAWKIFLAFTRTQVKVQGRKSVKDKLELSDIARLTKARANKVEAEHEILMIELAATKRQVVRQEEVVTVFSKLGTVLRGRLTKMRNDLPSALLGLDAAAMDKVLAERMEEAFVDFVLPSDFFDPRGVVSSL